MQASAWILLNPLILLTLFGILAKSAVLLLAGRFFSHQLSTTLLDHPSPASLYMRISCAFYPGIFDTTSVVLSGFSLLERYICMGAY